MFWFFRKSLNLGPIRLNLSKSGIGASVGAGGLRTGINAKGQPYASAQKYGIGARHIFTTAQSTSQQPMQALDYHYPEQALLITDKIDALIDEGKRKPSYINAYEKASKSLAQFRQATPLNGVEPLIIRVMLSYYDQAHLGIMGHGFTFTETQQETIATRDKLHLARTFKAALRALKQGNPTEEQQMIIDEARSAVDDAYQQLELSQQEANQQARAAFKKKAIIAAVIMGAFIAWLALAARVTETPHASVSSALSEAPSPTATPTAQRSKRAKTR